MLRTVTSTALISIGLVLHAQTWQVFDMATAGLPSNTTRTIAVAPNGDVWLGTDWGLCRYDGTQWDVFQMSNSAIPDNDIRALDVDTLGNVWVGMFAGGVSVFNETAGTWTTYNTSNSMLPEDQLRYIHIDHRNIAWLCTTGGLVRVNGTDWRVYNNSPSSYNGLQLPGNNIASVAVTQDNVACIGTLNAGFTYLTDTSVTVYSSFTTGLPDNTGLGVAVDDDGDRWVACPAGGLLLDGGGIYQGLWFQHSTVNTNIPSNSLNDVVVNAQGTKYIGSQAAGLIVFNSLPNWTNYNMGNSGIPDNDVQRVAVDEIGNIWVATLLGGAAKLELTTRIETVGGLVFSLYPNPASEQITFQLSKPISNGTYSILDATGRMAKKGAFAGAGPHVVDISALGPSLYSWCVNIGDSSMDCTSFIKQ